MALATDILLHVNKYAETFELSGRSRHKVSAKKRKFFKRENLRKKGKFYGFRRQPASYGDNCTAVQLVTKSENKVAKSSQLSDESFILNQEFDIGSKRRLNKDSGPRSKRSGTGNSNNSIKSKQDKKPIANYNWNDYKKRIHGDHENTLQQSDTSSISTVVAMDCEMVGVGENGCESMLARVSVVDVEGHCLLDKYVTPREKVTDYRTFVSGVTKELLKSKGEPFEKVQKEVSDLLTNRLLVGHALHNDLKVLFISHPKSKTRDTAKYKRLRKLCSSSMPSLKKLAAEVLGITIQKGQHSSVEDARAALHIYLQYRKQWEDDIKNKRLKNKSHSF